MAGSAQFLLTIVLIIFTGYKVEGWWGSWRWSENKPSNCPSEDNETHICSSLSSANGTCISIRCCTEEDGVEDEYSDDMEDDYDDDDYTTFGRHHHHHGGHHGCRLCVSVRNCTVYKCNRYCCEGYTTDWWGRCVEETYGIDCQNGGTPQHIGTGFYYSDGWTCLCTRNFTGKHCETPVCHCENGGQCYRGYNGQTYCTCRHGFTGQNCSEKVCTLNCQHGGSCMVDGDMEMCICPNGYEGELCEDIQVNDKQCPLPEYDYYYDCREDCYGNYDCYGNQVCCREGCSKVCRHPKNATCQHNGRSYPVGVNITQYDPCKNCTCQSSGEVICSTMTCSYCPAGTTKKWVTGQCCPKCEDDSIECQNGGTPYYQLQDADNYNGEWACSCTSQFTGKHCETKVCTLNCQHGGSCMVYGGVEMCICPSGHMGKTCEDNEENDRRCPAPQYDYDDDDCHVDCLDLSDCAANQICCKEGCSKVCRQPKDASCQRNDVLYPVGATVIQDDPCKNCTCQSSGEIICSAVSCAYCPTGTTQRWLPGECCPTCTGNPSPPAFENCPYMPINVTVGSGSNMASLTHLANGLVAKDYQGGKLQVSINPTSLSHCECTEPKKSQTTVVAKATDMYGSSAECRFNVFVIDREPPRFESCPDDIYVFEDEVVTWMEPAYKDNVGIYYTKCNKMNKDKTFPVGVHKITYTVIDFEYNIAVCDFQINSTSRDTDFDELPEGLRQRATDKKLAVAVIVAPIAGLLAVVIALVLLFFCCRRRQLAETANRPRPSRRQQYDNNIYAVCSPPPSIKGMKGMQLPQYTLPTNPPAYSSDMKEGEYAYIAPPSYKEVDDNRKNVYDNPGYTSVNSKTEDGEK